MKQITIYDLLPLLKKGWVAMDKDGSWHYHVRKPIVMKNYGIWGCGDGSTCLTYWAFNIAPFDGDWKDSLLKVGK